MSKSLQLARCHHSHCGPKGYNTAYFERWSIFCIWKWYTSQMQHYSETRKPS